ncbi:MAG: hypothetical protein QM599_00560 [Pseudoxanthomonas sp.]
MPGFRAAQPPKTPNCANFGGDERHCGGMRAGSREQENRRRRSSKSPPVMTRPLGASQEKNGRTAVFHDEVARRVTHMDLRHEKTRA